MSEEEFMSCRTFCSLKYSLASAHSEASKIYLSCRCDDINDVRSRSFSCHSEFQPLLKMALKAFVIDAVAM